MCVYNRPLGEGTRMRSRAWTPQARRWEVAPAFEQAGAWARQLGTAPLVAQVLHNRGVDSLEAAKAFLNPRMTDLHDPSLLSGAEAAAVRVAQAVAQGERIVLYGDYDVDGITGLAILHGCLRLLGAQSDFYVPHRLEEGYGFHAAAVRKIVEGGAQLLITVDCGISDGAAVAEAAQAGVDVIVTDHHGLPEELATAATGDSPRRAAAAIVHPALGEYPNRDLCGAGVAFKLAWAVARHAGGETRVDAPLRDFLVYATSLAALGTIADVVPLVGENRVLAWYGLKGLTSVDHPGLRALLESAGLAGKTIDAEDVGFKLAPRLNACGRMGHARQAVELFLGRDPARCRQIAEHLDKLNTQRQEVERATFDQAAEMVVSRRLDASDNPVIVLAGSEWHGGVIGIVAGRLVERFHRPAVLLTVRREGPAHGSCRSVGGFHMRDALAACGGHLESFGGHALAGGLRIDPKNIDAFAAAMTAYARGLPGAAAPEAPPLAIDARTTLAALSYPIVDALQRLAPFGQGNPPPLVEIEGCRLLTEPRRIGKSGQTVAFFLGQAGAPGQPGPRGRAGEGASLRAIGFGMGELVDHLSGARTVSVAAEPSLNRFHGATSVELRLKDVKRE